MNPARFIRSGACKLPLRQSIEQGKTCLDGYATRTSSSGKQPRRGSSMAPFVMKSLSHFQNHKMPAAPALP